MIHKLKLSLFPSNMCHIMLAQSKLLHRHNTNIITKLHYTPLSITAKVQLHHTPPFANLWEECYLHGHHWQSCLHISLYLLWVHSAISKTTKPFHYYQGVRKCTRSAQQLTEHIKCNNVGLRLPTCVLDSRPDKTKVMPANGIFAEANARVGRFEASCDFSNCRLPHERVD